MKFTVYALILVSLLSADSLGQDVGKFASVLRELKTNWHGVAGEFESFESNDPRSVPLQEPKQFRVWVSDDGTVFRTNSIAVYEDDLGARYQVAWKYITREFVFTRRLSWWNESEHLKTSDSAWILSDGGGSNFGNSFATAHCFFGLDKFTGAYWHDVLDDPYSRVSAKRVEGTWVVKAKNPKMGSFEFRFVNNPDLELAQMSCKNSFAEARDNVLSYEYHVSDIAYIEFDGRKFIKSIGDLSLDYIFLDGKKRSLQANQKLLKQSKNTEEMTERIAFPDFAVDEGATVRVLNDKGIPYKIRDGVLVRVVSGNALLDPQEARSREPRGFGYWWYIAVVALIFAAGLMLYRRR